MLPFPIAVMLALASALVVGACTSGGTAPAPGSQPAALSSHDVEDCVRSAGGRDYATTVAVCDRALKTESLTPAARAVALAGRGEGYGGIGDYDRAIEDFNAALALEPKLAGAYSWRGWAYRQQGKLDQAVADYDRFVTLRPAAPEGYHDRGIAYALKENYDRALADLTTAISLKADYAEGYNDRGLIYMIKGDTGPGIADYNQAVALRPDAAIPYQNRSVAFFIRRDYQRAISDVRHAIRIEPGNPFSYLWLYIISMKADEDPIAVLGSVTAADPGIWPSVIVRFYQGKATERDVQAEMSRAKTRRQAAERDCQAAFYLGEFELLNGRGDQAKSRLEHARDVCRIDLTERTMALVELARM